MSDIPTIGEAGLPGFTVTGWFSLVARAGTPRSTIDTLSRAATAHMGRSDVVERLAAVGLRTLTSTPEELATYAAAERAKWAQVVKDAGMTPQ